MSGAVAQRQSTRLTSEMSEVRSLPAPPSRYLTPAEKAQEIERWMRLRAEAERDGFTGESDRKGGHGYVDRGVLALTDALNAIEGVCTLQSCEGHEYSNGDGTRTSGAGGIWIWLDEPLARAFYRRASDLAEEPSIEQVALLWGRGRSREIIDLIFAGGVEHLTAFLPRWFSELRGDAC